MEACAYVMFYRKFINTFHVVVSPFYIYILRKVTTFYFSKTVNNIVVNSTVGNSINLPNTKLHNYVNK